MDRYENFNKTIELFISEANDNFRKGCESRQPEINRLVEALKEVHHIYRFSSHVRPPKADRVIYEAIKDYLPEEKKFWYDPDTKYDIEYDNFNNIE